MSKMAIIKAKIPKKIAQPVALFKELLASTKKTIARIIKTIIAKMIAINTAILGITCTNSNHNKESTKAMGTPIRRMSMDLIESSNKWRPEF